MDNLGNGYCKLGGTENIEKGILLQEEAIKIKKQLNPG